MDFLKSERQRLSEQEGSTKGNIEFLEKRNREVERTLKELEQDQKMN
jgi:prefoldin subunit 5